MNVRLGRDFTGLQSDLYFLESGEVQISGSVDSYVDYTGSCSFHDVAELLEIQPPKILSDAQSASLKLCGIGEQRLSYFMEPAELKNSINQVKQFCTRVLDSFEDSSYPERHIKNLRFLNSMQSARIDSRRLHSCDEIKSEGTLESFSSDVDGFMDPVRYSLTNSITGRMSVTAGPKILTTAKVVRSFLMSRYQDGCVIEIDFSNLEPRVALAIAGISTGNEDVYDTINKELLGGNVTREAAKLVTLSAMYGASERMLAEHLPNDVSPRKLIDSVRNKIRYHDTLANIKRAIEDKSRFCNHFGRPIIAEGERSARDAVLFSWFVQSSAVDVALSGFELLVRQLRKLNITFEPVFLIHDALILDIKRAHLDTIKTVCAAGSSSTELGNFPIKLTVLS